MTLISKAIPFSLIFLLSLPAFSQSNKDTPDEVFTEPAEAPITHIVLGITELLTARAMQKLNPHIEIKEVIAVRKAQKELDEARALFTSEAEVTERIERLRQLPRYNLAVLEQQSALARASIVTVEDKAAAIQRATQKVANAEAVLETVLNRPTLGLKMRQAGAKAVKVLKVSSQGYLVLSVFDRLYVYNALDNNPTLSPIAYYGGVQALRYLLGDENIPEEKNPQENVATPEVSVQN